MLPRKQRLSRLEIARFFPLRTPPRFTCAWFDLWAQPNSTNHNRYAIVIPNKTLTRAVDRAYSRRRIYALVRNWPNYREDRLIRLKPHIRSRQQVKNFLTGFVAAPKL